MFDSVKKTNSGFRRACGRCAGTGFLAHYANVWSGTCFKCDGAGALGKSFATAEECEAHIAKLELARERREAKREADRLAEWEADRPRREAEAKRQAEAQLAREAEDAQWAYVEGAVGDAVTVEGVIAVAVNVDTVYGTSRLIVIETPKREAVKVFTTAEWAWGVERGEALTVTGAIKAHTVYEGRAQTQLVRPKRIA